MQMLKLGGNSAFQSISNCWQKNKTKILTWGGVSLSVGACIGTVFATIKAVRKYDEIKAAADADGRELTKLDILAACGPYYVLSGSALIGGILFIGLSDKIQARDTLVAVSTCKFLEEQLERKERAELEVLDPKDVDEVQTREAADLIRNNPVPTEMESTGGGNTLFYDPLSGRYFRSSRDHNERAVSDFNTDLNSEMFKSVNEFYDYLNLKRVDLAEYAGWRVERGYISVSYKVVEASNGEACWVMVYSTRPRDDYRIVYDEASTER